MTVRGAWVFLGLMLLLPSAVLGQIVGESRPGQYDAQFGPPVTVTLEELLFSPESYDGRSVRTRGRLELSTATSRRGTLFQMRDAFGSGVLVVPIPEVATTFEQDAMRMLGSELRITGLFEAARSAQGSEGAPLYQITFWRYTGPPEPLDAKRLKAAKTVSVETLVQHPGQFDGKLVRVDGEFRGHNLFGELPQKSARDGDDWVLKDDLFAIWVTGRAAKGAGFALNTKSRTDAGKWLSIVGKPETEGGVVYLRASTVDLTTKPPPRPPPEETASVDAARPEVPPLVAFSLPIDGEREVAADGVFQVQFTRDMDEASFTGRVALRYRGGPRPGDQSLLALRLSYDGGRRVLVVDPGVRLSGGRTVELLLFPGILDMNGQPLVRRPEAPSVAEAVDVLQFEVAGGSLAF